MPSFRFCSRLSRVSRLARVAILAPAVLLPLYACEDGGSSSGGTFVPPEAGPLPEAGPGVDSSITPVDSSVPDAAPKGVTVTVVEKAGPVANVRVLAHDASGAVISDLRTNATGKVAFATAPSMITVLDLVNGGPVALTYLGVADGDALIATRPDPFPSGAPVGTYAVSITPFGVEPNYSIAVGGDNCGAFTNLPATPTNVDLYPHCLAATNTVLVTASGITNLGFGAIKGIAKPAAGATVSVGPVTVNAASTAKLDGALPAGTNVRADLRSIVGDFAFFTGSGNGTFGSGGISFPIAASFADAYQSLVVAEKTPANPRVAKGILRREISAAASPSFTYDLTQTLPFLTSATLAGATPARSDITITPEASLAAADGGLVSLEWTLVGGATQNRNWTFVIPPSTTTFKIPALPADATQYVPAANVAVASVAFFEASQLTGYTQLKSLPLPEIGELPLISDVTRPLPAAGAVKITALGRGSIIPPID